MLTSESTGADLYWFLAESFDLALAARNLSPHTRAAHKQFSPGDQL